jgi:hypothetical protein
MKLTIFEADLERDRQAITEVLDRNRDYQVDSRRFDWLYVKNPAGRARVWLLRDEDSGGAIGASAALPRRMWLRGEQVTCHVMSDFSIDVKYRSIGPALKLNRHSLTPVFDGEVPFAYDFPTETMTVAHKWLKAEPIGKQLRFVHPLRLDTHVQKFLGEGVVGQAASWLGNTALKAYATVRGLSPGYSAADEAATPGAFDSSFSELDGEVGPGFRVCGVRDRAYLDWRYGQNPLRKFRLVKLKRRDRLVGFAVYLMNEARVSVWDLFSLDALEVKRNLLDAVLAKAAAASADGVEVILLDTSPWIPMLGRRGYVQRPPEDKVYVFLPRETDLGGVVDNAASWYMTMGDNDT